MEIPERRAPLAFGATPALSLRSKLKALHANSVQVFGCRRVAIYIEFFAADVAETSTKSANTFAHFLCAYSNVTINFDGSAASAGLISILNIRFWGGGGYLRPDDKFERAVRDLMDEKGYTEKTARPMAGKQWESRGQRTIAGQPGVLSAIRGMRARISGGNAADERLINIMKGEDADYNLASGRRL